MSGIISERSANRGSCAQSCRKDYHLTDAATGRELDAGYLISARDLGAGEHLAEIAAAGVGCLKVEGRKKKPEYVAVVTRSYRDWLDRIGRGEPATPTPEETQPLVQIFSRGFTGGMYGGRAGREYVTRTHPDNRGAPLGNVIGREGNDLLIAVSHPVAVGDGLGFEHPAGASLGNTGFGVTRVRTLHEGEGRVTQAVRTDVQIPDGWVVVRSSQAGLNQQARASFTKLGQNRPAARTRVDVRAAGAAGGRLTLTFTADGA